MCGYRSRVSAHVSGERDQEHIYFMYMNAQAHTDREREKERERERHTHATLSHTREQGAYTG